MIKKSIITLAILAASGAASAAVQGGYIGAGVGVNDTDYKVKNIYSVSTVDGGATMRLGSHGALANVFAGVGSMVAPTTYLGAEVFVNGVNTGSDLHGTYFEGGDSGEAKVALYNKYSYGISLIPGAMLTDSSMFYGRFGVVNTRFDTKEAYSATDSVLGTDSVAGTSNHDVIGGQLGLGLQTTVNPDFDLRTEYTYTTYRSFNASDFGATKIQPTTRQFTLGFVYHIK